MKIACVILYILFSSAICNAQQAVKPVIKIAMPDVLVSRSGAVYFPFLFYTNKAPGYRSPNPGETGNKKNKKVFLPLKKPEPGLTVFPGLVMHKKKNTDTCAEMHLEGIHRIGKKINVLTTIFFSQNAEINYSALGYRLPFGNIINSSTEVEWHILKNISSHVRIAYLYEESPGQGNDKFSLHDFQSEASINFYPGLAVIKFSCLNILNKTTGSKRQKFQNDLFDPGAIEETDVKDVLPRNFRLSFVVSL